MAGILVVVDVDVGAAWAEASAMAVVGDSCTNGQERKEAGETVLQADRDRLLYVASQASVHALQGQDTGNRTEHSSRSLVVVGIHTAEGNNPSTAQDGCTALVGQASLRIIFESGTCRWLSRGLTVMALSCYTSQSLRMYPVKM